MNIPVEVSKHIHVLRDPELLVISIRRRSRTSGWAGETFVFLLGAAFFGLPFFNLVKTVLQQPDNLWSVGNLVAIPFLIAGGFLLYRTVTILVNTDTITVTPQELRVASAPLPPWDLTLPVLSLPAIASVDAKMTLIQSRVGKTYGGVIHTYAVQAKLVDGKEKEILGGCREPEPIYFAAGEISRFLTSLRNG